MVANCTRLLESFELFKAPFGEISGLGSGSQFRWWSFELLKVPIYRSLEVPMS